MGLMTLRTRTTRTLTRWSVMLMRVGSSTLLLDGASVVVAADQDIYRLSVIAPQGFPNGRRG